jgi:hypothetical protein
MLPARTALPQQLRLLGSNYQVQCRLINKHRRVSILCQYSIVADEGGIHIPCIAQATHDGRVPSGGAVISARSESSSPVFQIQDVSFAAATKPGISDQVCAMRSPREHTLSTDWSGV